MEKENPFTYYLLGGWREERDADKTKTGSIWRWGAIAKFAIFDFGLNKRSTYCTVAFHAIQIYVKLSLFQGIHGDESGPVQPTAAHGPIYQTADGQVSTIVSS